MKIDVQFAGMLRSSPRRVARDIWCQIIFDDNVILISVKERRMTKDKKETKGRTENQSAGGSAHCSLYNARIAKIANRQKALLKNTRVINEHGWFDDFEVIPHDKLS